MTADPASLPVVNLYPAKTDTGCASCGDQQTVQMSPYHGRLCSDHVTIPPGPFDRSLADDMITLGRIDAAFTYLRAWLVAEGVRRFGAVTV